MDTGRRLLQYVLAYKGRLGMAAVCSLIVAGTSLFMAKLIGWFMAAGSAKSGQDVLDIWLVQKMIDWGWATPESAAIVLIWAVAALLVAIHIPKATFTYLSNYLVASVTNRIGADIRLKIYAHIQTLSIRFFHKSRIGDLMSRMNNDVGVIQQSSTVVVQAINGPVMLIAGLGRMFYLSWQLTVLTILFVPLMGITIDRITRKIRSLTTATQATLGDVSAVIEESVRGIRVIKAFGTEKQEVERFGDVNRRSLDAALRAARRNSLVLPVIDLMGGTAAALIVLIGGWMVVHKQITFPVLTEFTTLAFLVADAAKQFGRLNTIYQQTVAAGERVFELLDTESDIVENPDGIRLTTMRGEVEFRDVGFEYNPSEPVIEHLSFKVDPGMMVAVVGPSGAGKSTVADLILRFYDVTAGQVLVDGADVRDLDTRSLRDHVAIVPQETILFSGRIADNISYGRPGATIEQITAAAKDANAHDFISALPDGYNTILGEGGVGLSGGQRQRLAIARALLTDPRILILDEATSALDVASEVVVQEALDRVMQGRSTIVIAHRLSTVRNANKIIVMERGQVVESGSFKGLMDADGVFAALYRSQTRSRELTSSDATAV